MTGGRGWWLTLGPGSVPAVWRYPSAGAAGWLRCWREPCSGWRLAPARCGGGWSEGRRLVRPRHRLYILRVREFSDRFRAGVSR